MSQSKILVVEDDAGLREALIDTLLLTGYECYEADSGEAALLVLKKQTIDLVVSDVQMPGMTGLALLKNIKNTWPNMPMLMMTAYGTIDDAVQAIKDGASNYMAKPFAPEVLLNMVSQYIPLKRHSNADPIAKDPSSIELLSLAKRVASTDASVMVLGPSGSGKEVLSQYIHQNSTRSEQPFIAINCAAIPENMLEATLFGYEKGAFTGAIQACPGKFEQAHGGTILLDEITEMDLGLQAKILRVLQEREVERLGGRKTISLDVRVIATSNRDLKIAVKEGVFREDLYYRLNVFPLTWLPLAKRPEDIMPLVEHLVSRYCKKSGDKMPKFSQSAIKKLTSYQWPGNVRELDNVVQRAMILHQNNRIQAEDILIEQFDSEILTDNKPSLICTPEPMKSSEENFNSSHTDVLGNELKQQEHQIILDALLAYRGSRKDVAEKLGISPRTLRYKIAKMRESGIEIPS